MSEDSAHPNEKPSATLPGIVERVIKPINPREPEKAQIAIEGAEDLYREIRIDNVLKDEDGRDVALREGAEVDVTIEADPEDTIKKKD
jgi:predicted DNA-binding antitoxin AbrB/MazE fold protein